MTGIATAYMDSIPMVAITGNVGLNSFRQGLLPGDRHLRHNHADNKAQLYSKGRKELADTVRKAFYLAGSGRKGPVLMDILKNVQTDECEYTPAKPEHYKPLPVRKEKLRPWQRR